MEEGAEAPSELARAAFVIHRQDAGRNGGGRRSALGAGSSSMRYIADNYAPQWRRAQKRPRSYRWNGENGNLRAAMEEGAEAPSELAIARRLPLRNASGRNGGGRRSALGGARRFLSHRCHSIPPQWRRAQKRPRRLAGDQTDWMHRDCRAAMEEGAEAPSEGSRFIVGLTWGFAPPLRAVGLAAWL